ncbi:MAG: MBL fold metallo-hydrolase [Trueperaceae bacterium]
MEPLTNIQHIANGVTRLELPARTLPPFTHTNTYVVADRGKAIVIDPGFYEESSLARLQQTLQGLRLESIVLTHTHPDHIEGLSLLRNVYGDVPIFVHDLEQKKVSQHGNVMSLTMNEALHVGTLELHPIFTPGHSPGHVSFYMPEAGLALVGDMVASFSSIWIGKPEGNIAKYFASLETLRLLKAKMFAPGHGEIIQEVGQKLEDVKQHRLQRLEQVYKVLENKTLTLSELRDSVYPTIDAHMAGLAEKSLLALLEKLEQDKRVTQANPDTWLGLP